MAIAGFDDELIYKEISLPENERKIQTFKIEDIEATAPFDEWSKNVDKRPY